MPRYQYACTDSACGHRFEAVQSFSDDPLSTCPVCEGRLRKVFSSVGVVFKGSGFYRTDSREAARNAAKGTGDGGPGEKKSESSSSASSASPSSSGSTGSGSSRSGTTAGSGSSGSSSGSTTKAAAS